MIIWKIIILFSFFLVYLIKFEIIIQISLIFFISIFILIILELNYRKLKKIDDIEYMIYIFIIINIMIIVVFLFGELLKFF